MGNPTEKRLPELSARMMQIVDMISYGSTVADIGCDHGYVAIYLYNSGRCPKCIASDIKEGPLLSAKKNIELYKAGTGVDARLSDGLSNIKTGETDCILIAGMGGVLITQILSAYPEKTSAASELVLEPQSEAAGVRRFLYDNGFTIVRESLVTERGKYYPVIKAVRSSAYEPLSSNGKMTNESELFSEDQSGNKSETRIENKLSKNSETISEDELIYGPCLIKDKNQLLKKYLEKETDRIKAVMNRLKTADSACADARYDQLKKELETAIRVYGKI